VEGDEDGGDHDRGLEDQFSSDAVGHHSQGGYEHSGDCEGETEEPANGLQADVELLSDCGQRVAEKSLVHVGEAQAHEADGEDP
jgi:hypothetical protein